MMIVELMWVFAVAGSGFVALQVVLSANQARRRCLGIATITVPVALAAAAHYLIIPTLQAAAL